MTTKQKQYKPRGVSIHLYAPAELVEDFERLARSKFQTKSELVRRLIFEAVQKDKARAAQ